MDYKLLFSMAFLQTLSVFSSSPDVTTVPAQGNFKSGTTIRKQVYQGIPLKIFAEKSTEKEVAQFIPADEKQVQTVLDYMKNRPMNFNKSVQNVSVLLTQKAIIITFNYGTPSTIFQEYPLQTKEIEHSKTINYCAKAL